MIRLALLMKTDRIFCEVVTYLCICSNLTLYFKVCITVSSCSLR